MTTPIKPKVGETWVTEKGFTVRLAVEEGSPNLFEEGDGEYPHNGLWGPDGKNIYSGAHGDLVRRERASPKPINWRRVAARMATELRRDGLYAPVRLAASLTIYTKAIKRGRVK